LQKIFPRSSKFFSPDVKAVVVVAVAVVVAATVARKIITQSLKKAKSGMQKS
jgi:hypothetical protein